MIQPEHNPPLKDLEIFGVLFAKLVHDLNNGVGSIAAGLEHAKAALKDAERGEDALENALGALADLEGTARRYTEIAHEYPVSLGSCDTETTARIMRDLFAGLPGWETAGDPAPGGDLPLSPRWLEFAMEEIVSGMGRKGSAEFSSGEERRILRQGAKQMWVTPSPNRNWFLCLEYRANGKPPTIRELTRDGAVSQMLAAQVLRLAAGWAQSVQLDDARWRTLISLPIRDDEEVARRAG